MNLDLDQQAIRRRLDRWLLVVCPTLLVLTFGLALLSNSLGGDLRVRELQYRNAVAVTTVNPRRP